jgi:hypothetical protein
LPLMISPISHSKLRDCAPKICWWIVNCCYRSGSDFKCNPAHLLLTGVADVITTSASQRTEYTLRYPTKKGSERRRPR